MACVRNWEDIRGEIKSLSLNRVLHKVMESLIVTVLLVSGQFNVLWFEIVLNKVSLFETFVW